MSDETHRPSDRPRQRHPGLDLILGRRSIAPKRLAAPGPDASELRVILEAAATAPDHEQLQPWRFVRIGPQARGALAELFAQALLERDPAAAEEDLRRARDKAHRAPELLLAVVRHQPQHANVPAPERYVALGCALMNVLLAAHAQGFGAMITSGKALQWRGFARAFHLADDEEPVCFVSIGTPGDVKRRSRPDPGQLVSEWIP